MRKLFIIALFGIISISAKAQTTNNAITEHDAATKAKDEDIKTNLIDRAVADAGGEAPDWEALKLTITKKYDAVTADRTVTKGKIYFYYRKDWPVFCESILHYTDSYELANDYKLLNKNAAMILKNCNDMAQLKKALRWSKAALDSDPKNESYKTTYDGLTAKIEGK